MEKKCTNHEVALSRGGRFSTSLRYTRGGLTSSSAGAGAAGAQPKVFVNQCVDHRPRAVLVSGFEADEIDAVIAHFAQYGEVVGREINAAVPELTLQYRARAQAELAALRGRHYNDRTLSITWVTNSKPITPVSVPASTPTTAPTPTPAASVAAVPNSTTSSPAPAQQNGTRHDSVNHEENENNVFFFFASSPRNSLRMRFSASTKRTRRRRRKIALGAVDEASKTDTAQARTTPAPACTREAEKQTQMLNGL
ncbi:Zinc finger protein swm [Eumeta japonica]|uniref:Zinc finger protein swm n=1 Tax=Eumeta variegata TaxID=151549 RepID=A0A4C1VXC6_EUMVA|nr:Zinc finger protein swm [Eumeta japonica]